MSTITDLGIYRISPFEYEVNDVVFEENAFTGTGMFGKFEIDIAAFELLRFSKEAGEWVGVSWTNMATHLDFPIGLSKNLPGFLFESLFEAKVGFSDIESVFGPLTTSQMYILVGLHLSVGRLIRVERRYAQDSNRLHDVLFPTPAMIIRVGDTQRIAGVTG